MAMRPDADATTRMTQVTARMRQLGLGERVLKTALAAGISWQLAAWIPGNDHPYLAPVTALLMLQLTIAESLERVLQRTIGIAFAIGAAVLAYSLFEVRPWSVGLVVLLALAAGIQLRLGPQALQQIAITALVVLLARSIEGTIEYAGYQMAAAAIGAGVALLLNWAIAPPVYVTPAGEAIERMAQQLAVALAELTTSFRRGMTATAAAAHLETARAMAASLATSHEALMQAEQSLRFNRFRGSRAQDLANLHMASRALEHCAIQTRVMCRSIVTAFDEGAADWLAPEIFGRSLADLFGRNTALVRFVGGDRGGVRPPIASTAEIQQEMRDYWQTRTDRGWLYAGEVLTVAERMASELQATIDAQAGGGHTVSAFR